MRKLLWESLNVLLWATAAGLCAYRYALPGGVVSAILGAALGVWTGRVLAKSPLRLWVFALLGLLAAWLGWALSALATLFPGVAALLDPSGAYAIGEMAFWLLLPFGAVMVLEAVARHHPPLRVAEFFAVALVYAALFAAHREGFINRPFFLVDPLWGNGRNPLGYFLLIGLALAALLAVTLAKGAPGRRSFIGLMVLLALMAAIFMMLPQGQLKEVFELHRVMGKDGKEKQGDKGQKNQRGGPNGKESDGGKSGSSKDQDLPDTFSDQSSGQQNSPVAVVVFHEDYKPPLGYYYFRETAFSTYNGVRVVQDVSGRYDRDVAREFGTGTENIPLGGSLEQSGAPGASKAFKRVRTTVALMAPHPRPFGLVNPSQFTPTSNPDARRFFRAYDAVSSALMLMPKDIFGEKAGSQDWDSGTWRHYTDGPSDPRYGALADQIVSALPEAYRKDSFARAVEIKLWLDKHGTYSLTSKHGDSPDPVADFLFGDLTGHCVHFAHAACLLYRAAGVPARVAAGYAVQASFRGGGASLLIRSRDAHAWPEIFLEGVGWMPLDIAPEKSLVKPEEAPDQGLQQMLGEMAMKDKPPPPPPPEEKDKSVIPLLKALAKALIWMLAVLAALSLPVSYCVKLWRRYLPLVCRPAKAPRLCYRAALDRLSEIGIRRRFGEAPEEFARFASRLAPSFEPLAQRAIRKALGPKDQDPEPKQCLLLLEGAVKEYKARAGRLRRWLGLLNPVSWWFAR